MPSRLETAVAALPRSYPGPGGAVAVLRGGETLVRHAWGYANAERRLPFTPATLFRFCSITKQFTCALLLDQFPDPAVLDQDLRALLPNLEQAPPATLQLCHNQSGLRDYWALAMLHGALAESPFADDEATRVIAGARTLQFIPGTRYSYVNQNFRLLCEMMQHRAGRSFAELLRSRIFARAGMASALLAADTRAMPDGTEGYEGTQPAGFRPAENRIIWTGDAGLGASLDDMIAWERHIDSTRDDPASLYRRITRPVTFADGTPSPYGFGLNRGTEWGRAYTGHGGALRGWRSHRLYLPQERISVVVMFNHLSDAREAAFDLLGAALDIDRPRPPAPHKAPDWAGAWLDPNAGLAVRIDTLPDGQLRLRYGHSPERLDLQADGTATSPTGTVIRATSGGLAMDRPQENARALLQPRAGSAALDIAGRYRCDELDADLTIADAGGALYGGFSGFLGHGRMELLEPVGPDLWTLPCQRALDHTPPGDWTLHVQRGSHTIEVGCWLARRLPYRRVG
ncbi:MAG TPA: D-aminopeptidase [Acetobacteraceae bacterium]|nr:D-aminopeptidase [Acetobacteraceae bacterium]